MFKDLYQTVEPTLLTKVKQLKLIAFDVDGIFSDGQIFLGNQGEELKGFHTLDGYGIKRILALGMTVIVITGRESKIVENRMKSLGVCHLIQNCEDKRQAMSQFIHQHNFSHHQIAAMGDDMPDLGMFALSGISFSVPNGHPYVRQQADYVTTSFGGRGAVREVCDLILDSHNVLVSEQGKSE